VLIPNQDIGPRGTAENKCFGAHLAFRKSIYHLNMLLELSK
jgi:hypothetical protein